MVQYFMEHFANTDHFLYKRQHGDKSVKYLSLFIHFIPNIQNPCVSATLMLQYLVHCGLYLLLADWSHSRRFLRSYIVKPVISKFFWNSDASPPFLQSWSVITFMFSSKIPHASSSQFSYHSIEEIFWRAQQKAAYTLYPPSFSLLSWPVINPNRRGLM